jgi:hypothetical protein
MPKWVTQFLLPFLCGLLVLVAFIGLNSFLRAYLHKNERVTIAFSEIECDPPGKLSREEFLTEVQYLANWPDELNLLDPGLPARLHLSFAVHPWVESVERVKIVPPRQVRVVLRHRQPALTIAQTERVVDRHGVLLPLDAADPQLPVLCGNIATPTGHTGQPWGDPAVGSAASVAVMLAPHQQTLHLQRFELSDGLLILSNPLTRVIWGPPGDDKLVEVKLQALLKVVEERGRLDGPEIDLRKVQPAP